MMDVIVFDGVVMGRREIVGPAPADRDAGVQEVANLVVQHLVDELQPISTPMPA